MGEGASDVEIIRWQLFAEVCLPLGQMHLLCSTGDKCLSYYAKPGIIFMKSCAKQAVTSDVFIKEYKKKMSKN